MTQNTPQKYLYHITGFDISQFNWDKLHDGALSMVDKELYTFDDLDIAQSHFCGSIGGTSGEHFDYYSLEDSSIMSVDALCTDINKKLPENVSVSPDLLKKLPVGRAITLKDIESVFKPLPIDKYKRLGFPENEIKQQIETRKKQIMALSKVFKDKTLKLGTMVQGIQFEGYPITELKIWEDQQTEKYHISYWVIDDFLSHSQYQKTPFTKEYITKIYESYHQNVKIEQKEIDALCSIFEGKKFKPVNFIKPESRRILKVALKPEAKIVLRDFPLRFSGIETVPDKAIYTLLNLPLNTTGEELVKKVLKYNKYHFDTIKPVVKKQSNRLNLNGCFVEASYIKRDATIPEMIECYEKEGPLAYKTKYGYSQDEESQNCLLKKFDELKALKQTYDDFSQKLGLDTARKLGIIDDKALQQKALEVAKMIILYLSPKKLHRIFGAKRLRYALVEMGIAGFRELSVYNLHETKGDTYHIFDLNAVRIESYMNASTNMQWRPVARPPEKTPDKKQEKPQVDLLRQMGAIGGSWR